MSRGDIPFHQPHADPSTLPCRVFTYRNLHKSADGGDPVYSLRDTATGLVAAHAPTVYLRDVDFVVSASGRDRVRREQRKNVHAGLRGTPIVAAHAPDSGWRRARYNPYTCECFIDADTSSPVHGAAYARIDSTGVAYIAHEG